MFEISEAVVERSESPGVSLRSDRVRSEAAASSNERPFSSRASSASLIRVASGRSSNRKALLASFRLNRRASSRVTAEGERPSNLLSVALSRFKGKPVGHQAQQEEKVKVHIRIVPAGQLETRYQVRCDKSQRADRRRAPRIGLAAQGSPTLNHHHSKRQAIGEQSGNTKLRTDPEKVRVRSVNRFYFKV